VAYEKRDYLPPLLQLLRTIVPSVPPRKLRSLALEAMPDPHFHGTMLRYLERNSDALTTGRADMPPSVIRLADSLIAAGAKHIRRPVCSVCQEAAKKLPYKHGDGRVCGACFKDHVNAQICARCGKRRAISKRLDGAPICNSCWRKDPSQLEECSVCRTLSSVAVRRNGNAVCQLCYEQPRRPCGRCAKLRPIHSSKGGVEVCRDCYNGKASRRKSNIAPIRHRSTRRRTCSSCGTVRACVDYVTASPLCIECAGRPLRTCVGCGSPKPVHAVWEGGPVCSTCYSRFLETERSCPECGRLALLVPTRTAPKCRSCLGSSERSGCHFCGERRKIYESGKCVTCVLQDRASALLTDDDGSLLPDLEPVYEALVNIPKPITALNWMRRSKGAKLLRAIALGEIGLSHAALDELGPAKPIAFLRSLLVASNVLPERSAAAERLDRWLDHFLVSKPPEEAFLVQTYAQWQLFRRLRHKIERNTLTDAGYKSAQSRIRVAAQFLAWLRDRGLTLDLCTQHHIDDWLSSSSSTAYGIRDFIRWTSRRRFSPKLVVPSRTVKTAQYAIDEDERWHQVERLLHDGEIPLDLRLIGLLNLVFAQHASRVCSLAVDEVRERNDDVYVRFGEDDVLMPPDIGTLVKAQAASSLRNPKSRTRSGKHWLFPGQGFGTHVSSDSIGTRLSTIGIRTRPSRNAALMQLAASLDPAILAQMLNLHPNTAVAWSLAAGRTFNRHIARRLHLDAGTFPEPGR
jgi:integrase